MTKHVTLFGRKMIKGRGFDYYHLPGVTLGKELDSRGDMAWYGSTGNINVNGFATPHAAARALERKIVAAHRMLGKLIGGKK